MTASAKRRYDYLLWDVDDTLLDFSYSERESLSRCLKAIGVTATDEMIGIYSRINDGWWKRLEKGEVTKEQLLNGRFADFFAALGLSGQDVESFRLAYQHGLGNIFKYMEDSLNICKKLKDMGYHQYTVTNGVAAVQERKLKLSGFADVFEGNFISEQLGTPKPQLTFFDACFSQLTQTHKDFCKESVLIIGDSLTSDIQGGRNAGIHTCWYQPGSDCASVENMGEKISTYRIQSLEEIFDIV